jgi:hypothetical protein
MGGPLKKIVAETQYRFRAFRPDLVPLEVSVAQLLRADFSDLLPPLLQG